MSLKISLKCVHPENDGSNKPVLQEMICTYKDVPSFRCPQCGREIIIVPSQYTDNIREK